MEIVKIKDVTTQIRGVSYKPENVSETYKEGYVELFRANNISDYGIIFENTQFVESKCVSEKQLLKKNDILIAASSGSKHIVGKASKINVDNKNTSFGAFCKVLRPLNNINADYLSHYFSSPIYRRTISALSEGANINNIRNENLDNLEIPFPPLTTQKAISEKLDKADALRKKDQELLAQYDELAQAIFIDMFGDPVKNEKGWEITNVENVCSKIYGGGTPSKSKPEYYDGNIPWVTPKDMKYDYIINSRDHINENAVANSSAKIIPIDCLLMVIRSGILKHTLPLGINKVEVTINQDMKAFIPNLSKTNSIFLKGFFKAVESYLLTKVRAVTADNFEFSQIKELNFPLVPLKLQTQFEKKIQNIEAQKALVKQQSQQSEDLFQALLQESFNF